MLLSLSIKWVEKKTKEIKTEKIQKDMRQAKDQTSKRKIPIQKDLGV